MGKSRKQDIADSQRVAERTLILRWFELLPTEWTTSPALSDWAGIEVGEVDTLLGELQSLGIIMADFDHGGYGDSTKIRWSLTGASRRTALDHPLPIRRAMLERRRALEERIAQLQADLAEEQRVHQQDVAELKGRITMQDYSAPRPAWAPPSRTKAVPFRPGYYRARDGEQPGETILEGIPGITDDVLERFTDSRTLEGQIEALRKTVAINAKVAKADKRRIENLERTIRAGREALSGDEAPKAEDMDDSDGLGKR
jgi:hypothetical protein